MQERTPRRTHGAEASVPTTAHDDPPRRPPPARDPAPQSRAPSSTPTRSTPPRPDNAEPGRPAEGRPTPPPSPSEPFDPVRFADRIRAEWDAVAEDWGDEAWRSFVEAGAGVVSERLLDLARVGPGHRVLDLGTGVGEPAGLAARRVGPGGRVHGVDLSPRMIEQGRRRMERLGLDQVELQVGDAGHPDFPEASFDAAVSRWVLMLVPDLGAALGRIRKVLRPGGRLAVGLWGHPDRVPMISAALGVAESLFPMPPTPPDAPTHLWHHGAEAFADRLREAGFTEVGGEAVDVVFEWSTPGDFAEFITAMAGPLRVVSESLPPPLRQRLRRGLEEAAADLAVDGRLRLANETLCIAGRRP